MAGSATLLGPDGLVACQLGLAVLEERDVGGGAAHVEGDEVAVAQEPRRVPAARDAARGAGEHRARGQPHRVGDARDAAVRLHDEDLARVAARLEPLREAPQVGRQRRADVGIDHRRAEALVLLDLRQHLRGERRRGRAAAPSRARRA